MEEILTPKQLTSLLLDIRGILKDVQTDTSDTNDLRDDKYIDQAIQFLDLLQNPNKVMYTGSALLAYQANYNFKPNDHDFFILGEFRNVVLLEGFIEILEKLFMSAELEINKFTGNFIRNLLEEKSAIFTDSELSLSFEIGVPVDENLEYTDKNWVTGTGDDVNYSVLSKKIDFKIAVKQKSFPTNIVNFKSTLNFIFITPPLVDLIFPDKRILKALFKNRTFTLQQALSEIMDIDIFHFLNESLEAETPRAQKKGFFDNFPEIKSSLFSNIKKLVETRIGFGTKRDSISPVLEEVLTDIERLLDLIIGHHEDSDAAIADPLIFMRRRHVLITNHLDILAVTKKDEIENFFLLTTERLYLRKSSNVGYRLFKLLQSKMNKRNTLSIFDLYSIENTYQEIIDNTDFCKIFLLDPFFEEVIRKNDIPFISHFILNSFDINELAFYWDWQKNDIESVEAFHKRRILDFVMRTMVLIKKDESHFKDKFDKIRNNIEEDIEKKRAILKKNIKTKFLTLNKNSAAIKNIASSIADLQWKYETAKTIIERKSRTSLQTVFKAEMQSLIFALKKLNTYEFFLKRISKYFHRGFMVDFSPELIVLFGISKKIDNELKLKKYPEFTVSSFTKFLMKHSIFKNLSTVTFYNDDRSLAKDLVSDKDRFNEYLRFKEENLHKLDTVFSEFEMVKSISKALENFGDDYGWAQ